MANSWLYDLHNPTINTDGSHQRSVFFFFALSVSHKPAPPRQGKPATEFSSGARARPARFRNMALYAHISQTLGTKDNCLH